uniref:Uncharacterized protein n=1 Tax=Lepeophtheirus salmonis TaxID=72036 RepID=A0A0K2TE90_LEPSM
MPPPHPTSSIRVTPGRNPPEFSTIHGTRSRFMDFRGAHLGPHQSMERNFSTSFGFTVEDIKRRVSRDLGIISPLPNNGYSP